MEPASVLNTLDTVANILGVPAAMFLGWVYLRVRQLGAEVETLKKARDDDRKETDMKLNAIFDRLNLLLADVSFIKGRFSENK